MNERNEMLLKQEMDKRARIKKEFLAHAEDFHNPKYLIEKVEGGYIITSLVDDQWSFKITEGEAIQQLSEGPKSWSEGWAYKFMEAWMSSIKSVPKKHNRGRK